MRSPTFLTDPLVPLVADSSTVINLIATGCAPAIITALPNRIVVVDVIPGELDTGRQQGHPHADALQDLVAAGTHRNCAPRRHRLAALRDACRWTCLGDPR